MDSTPVVINWTNIGPTLDERATFKKEMNFHPAGIAANATHVAVVGKVGLGGAQIVRYYTGGTSKPVLVDTVELFGGPNFVSLPIFSR